jgi:hypothetical protein
VAITGAAGFWQLFIAEPQQAVAAESAFTVQMVRRFSRERDFRDVCFFRV